jgi:hypothetical protein
MAAIARFLAPHVLHYPAARHHPKAFVYYPGSEASQFEFRLAADFGHYAAAAIRPPAPWHRRASRLQDGIPIEIIHPAFVQIIGRKPAAVLVQIVDGRLIGHPRRPHARLAGT